MNNMKRFYPFIITIIVGLVLTGIFFYPQLEGKTVYQLDIVKNIGMRQEAVKYREIDETSNILWTNSMFGGMPTTMISMVYNESIYWHLNKLFMMFMPRSSGFLFLYFIGFFILIYSQNKNIWISIFGAIAFALSTYFIIIIEAGHNAKANSIGYMAPLIAGILLTYRGKLLTGGILTAIFAGLHIMANHFQITYYLLFLIFFLLIAELIIAIQNKTTSTFIKASGVMLIAAIFAIGPNLNIFMSAYNYSQHTIRGKSELNFNEEQKSTSGLDKDYITAWSYGKDETLSLLIPNVKGGISNLPINKHTKAIEKVEPQYKNIVGQFGSYWGEQPFTSGPVYVGAFIFFLFILGLFILKGWHLRAMLIATFLAILLAWGRHFMPLTDWFIDNFPYYNKFRTVSTFLVIPQLVIPFIAAQVLYKVYKTPDYLKAKMKYFWISFAVTGGVALLIYLMPNLFFSSFLSTQDHQQLAEFIKQGANQLQMNAIADNLEIARIGILKADAIRSFLFITLGAGVIWLWLSKTKMKKELFIALLFIILLADLIPINKRYLNESQHFVAKTKMQKPFPQSQADTYILADNDPDFRVLNLAVNIFNDASTSFYHKSIGGYHAAKLQRYQDLISYKLQNEINAFINTLQSNPTDSSINASLQQMRGLNMLNTKYIIYNPQSQALLNKHAYGNAWFADKILIADDADEEMNLLLQIDLSKNAIINKSLTPNININDLEKDTNAIIQLTSYHPEKLKYNVSTQTPQYIVFSEIYYPDWEAYIDGQKTDIYRTNYVLRGIEVPQGNHNVEFVFNPSVYKKGKLISLIFSIIVGSTLVVWLVWEAKKKKTDIIKE